MTMRWLIVVLLLWGCTPPPALLPTVRVDKRVEEEVLPPDPQTEPLEGIPSEEWVLALEAGACAGVTGTCPSRSGILMSEGSAARFGLFKLRYIELRKLFEEDRLVWRAHRELYEERLKLADKAIQDLQPSWWDRHKGELGLVGGFLLGAATTIAIVSAVY
jgi:hypothetical protein